MSEKILMCPNCKLPRHQKKGERVVVSLCGRCGAIMEVKDES